MPAGDFRHNGKTDVAVVNFSSNDVSVSLGNGDGIFQPAVNYAVGKSPVAIGVGDFNGDGKFDIVTVNLTDNNVSVLLGNGMGRSKPPRIKWSPTLAIHEGWPEAISTGMAIWMSP